MQVLEKTERSQGKSKYDAVTIAHQASAQSIMVSAFSFFAATVGVGIYSNIDMISSLCILMARGAVVSMVVVVLILPSMFMVFDRVIVKTSRGFLSKEAQDKRKNGHGRKNGHKNNGKMAECMD